jgi:hypothetical protein
VALVARTREAGEGLMVRTRAAGSLFLGDTRDATRAFFTETRKASSGFVGGLEKEGRNWFDFVGEKSPLPNVELRLFVTPQALGTHMVRPIKDAIEAARVRLLKPEGSSNPPQAVKAVKAVKAPKAARKPSAKRFPVSGYDVLNAKEAIGSLAKLTPAQLRTVLAYEEANKGRVTVIRAAGQRLAN